MASVYIIPGLKPCYLEYGTSFSMNLVTWDMEPCLSGTKLPGIWNQVCLEPCNLGYGTRFVWNLVTWDMEPDSSGTL